MKLRNSIIIVMMAIIILLSGYVAYIVAMDYFGKQIQENDTKQQVTPVDRSTYVTDVYDNNIDSVMSVVNTNTIEILKNSKGEAAFTKEVAQGIGTGFVYDYEDGYYYVITNYHVIAGGDEVRLIFNGQSDALDDAIKAEVVGYSESDDIALLRFKSDAKISPVVLGDSDVVVPGEDAIAMGSPYGLEYSGSITKGIVSSSSRLVEKEDGTYAEYIQTDAAINPGNSGGPLFNAAGEVIGMNTMKLADAQSDNMGFAIPINYVIEICDQIRSGKETPQDDSNTMTIEDIIQNFLK